MRWAFSIDGAILMAMKTRSAGLVVLCLAQLLATWGAENGESGGRIDLRGVRIVASHATPGDEFKVENAIDGDPETKWVGEAHPLSFQPANIVIEFPAAQKVSGVVLLSTVFREKLALRDVE